METKFLKYWETLPFLNVVAAILDPRFKEEGTFVIIEQFLEVMQLNNKIDINQEKQKYSKFIEEMYAEYEPIYGANKTPQTHSVEPDSSKISRKVWNILSKKSKGSSSTSGGSDESNKITELTIYYRTDFISHFTIDEIEHFNVLQFWKDNSKTWPVLAAMARDVLTPPMSTVPSECTFSASGRVLDEKRSNLTANHLEMCVLLKDWLDAESRNNKRMAQEFSDDSAEEDLEHQIEEATREVA